MMTYAKAQKYQQLQRDIATTYAVYLKTNPNAKEYNKAVKAWEKAIERSDAFFAKHDK